MSEKVGKFYTTKNFKYEGKLISETPTHYVIFDFVSGKQMELLKITVEKVVWEGDAV